MALLAGRLVAPTFCRFLPLLAAVLSPGALSGRGHAAGERQRAEPAAAGPGAPRHGARAGGVRPTVPLRGLQQQPATPAQLLVHRRPRQRSGARPIGAQAHALGDLRVDGRHQAHPLPW